ncbi:MAG TPA: hypothetical protein VKZ63_04935 [Kofleriaceae bacterium]|nr:hypothetical protein [Kofleriaceae bacterium]
MRVAAVTLLALAVVAPASGRAQPAPPDSPPLPGGAGAPAARRQVPIARPLVLPAGACEAALVVESNLTVREVAEPLSLAPDLRCGVSPRITLGVVHSARALSLVDSGGGLCLTGDDDGCTRPYDGGAVDALADLTGPGRAAAAARARLVVRSLEPFKPSLRLGALVRLRAGRVALLLDPHVSLALAHERLGNRDAAALPAYLEILIGSRVLLHLHSGVRGELDGFDEKFEIPIAAGVLVELSPAWDLSLEAGFNQLLGPQNTFKQRHGAVAVTYRFAIAPPRPAARSYTAR